MKCPRLVLFVGKGVVHSCGVAPLTIGAFLPFVQNEFIFNPFYNDRSYSVDFIPIQFHVQWVYDTIVNDRAHGWVPYFGMNLVLQMLNGT